MKLRVFGGGGARSVFLTKSLVKSAKEINVDHIVLMNDNEKKLMKYGTIAKGLCMHPLANDLETARKLTDIIFHKYSMYIENRCK